MRPLWWLCCYWLGCAFCRGTWFSLLWKWCSSCTGRFRSTVSCATCWLSVDYFWINTILYGIDFGLWYILISYFVLADFYFYLVPTTIYYSIELINHLIDQYKYWQISLFWFDSINRSKIIIYSYPTSILRFLLFNFNKITIFIQISIINFLSFYPFLSTYPISFQTFKNH